MRGSALGIVRVTGIAGPGATGIARTEYDGICLGRAAGIAAGAVVFAQVGLGENDRALGAKLRHNRRVRRSRVHAVGNVRTARRAHILGVENVFDRKRRAVKRQRGEIRIGAELAVQLPRSFKSVGLGAECLAALTASVRQRAFRRMQVARGFTGRGAFAADVDGA